MISARIESRPSVDHRLPPGPRLPAALQTVAWSFRTVQFLEACAKRYGEAFTNRYIGFGTEISFTSPSAIKEIFAGDAEQFRAGEVNQFLEPVVGARSVLLLDGDAHLEQRKLLLPPFHGERMQAYGERMRELAQAEIARWPLGEPFSFHRQMQGLTLDIILSTVFGVDRDPLFDRLRELLSRLLDSIKNPLLVFKPLQRDLPIGPYRAVMQLSREIDDQLNQVFARRRAEGRRDRTDILSMLLEATHEDGRPMSDAELRDEMRTLLVAGHETTATALAWAVFRILATPRTQARLQEELGAQALDAGKVARLEYLDATVKETLRLNPVIPDVGRRLKAPARIGGYDLPVGVHVLPAIYLTHRRADLWPEPLEFRPERFIGLRPDPTVYLPFGGGRRRCIGMAFAQYEMKVILAEIISRTELRLSPGYRGRPVRRAVTLVPEEGLPITLVRRRA
jgi:cytochrome P450